MKAMQNIKRVTTGTRAAFTNGGTEIKRLEDHIDKFLDNAEALDRAAWKVVREARTRVYSFLAAFTGEGKATMKHIDEVKDAWTDLAESAMTLGKDFRRVGKTVQARATARVTG